MKKILLALLGLLVLVGCTPSEKPIVDTVEATAETTVEPTPEVTFNELNVLVPKGAPAVAMLPLYGNDLFKMTSVDGTDVLQAAFVNPEPEYDVIVAPSNLGAKLADARNTTYKMIGIVTWGNLYVVGDSTDALEKDGSFAAFGEQAVPQKVFETVLPDITPEVTYYNSVADAQAALLSGNATSALIAEPAATATIAKAKENGLELSIIADLQELWGEGGYPQAAIFVNSATYEDNKASIDNMIKLAQDYSKNKTDDTLTSDIETIGVEELGVPSSAIIIKTYDRLNINVVYANEHEEELSKFLQLFGITSLENVLQK